MEENSFCTSCGYNLPEGATFCPQCGANVNGPASGYDPRRGYDSRPKMGFLILILLYGVFATILGLLDTLSYMSLTEETYQATIDMLSDMLGMDASEIMPAWYDNMPRDMAISSACMMLSGMVAVVCYVKTKKADDFRMSVLLCAVASVLPLGMAIYPSNMGTAVILCVIGLLMTYLMYSKKEAFSG